MFRIIGSNLIQRRKNYIAVFLELVVVLLVSYLVLDDLFTWIDTQDAYRKLELDRVVYFTMLQGEASLVDVSEITGVEDLGRSYTEKYAGGIALKPVTEAYISCIPYTYQKKMDWEAVDGLKAVIPKSLSVKYKLGKSYTLEVGEGEEVKFTVVGITKEEWMFWPVATGGGNSFVRRNTVLLFGEEEAEDSFVTTDTYTLWFADPRQKSSVTELFVDAPEITEIAELTDKNEKRIQLELEVMGEPILVMLFVVLLCCTAMISHVLLSVIAFENKYGICHICGSTWGKCVRIQIFTDALPALLAVLVSEAGLFLYTFCKQEMIWNGRAAAAGAGLVFVIFVLSEFLGGIRMRKKNPVEIVEAVYG